MSLSKESVYSALFESTMQFFTLRPWEIFEEGECFAVEIPNEEHLVFGTIMGQAGSEFGLTLTYGEDAFANLTQMMINDQIDHDFIDGVNLLGFSLWLPEECPIGYDKFMEEAGEEWPEEGPVPVFIIKPKNEISRIVNFKEAKTLLYALNGFLASFDEDAFDPLDCEDPEIFLLKLTGSPLDPEFEIELIKNDFPVKISEKVRQLPRMPDVDLDTLPRTSDRWLVGFPIIPARIENDNRVVRGLLIVDEESELIIQLQLVMGVDLDEATAFLIGTFAGQNPSRKTGIPASITIDNKSLFEHLNPILKAKNIDCAFQPDIAILDNISAEISKRMSE